MKPRTDKNGHACSSFLKLVSKNYSITQLQESDALTKNLAEVSWEKMVELAKANAQHRGGIVPVSKSSCRWPSSFWVRYKNWL